MKRGQILAFCGAGWGYMGNPAGQLLSQLSAKGWDIVYNSGALSVWDRGKPAWLSAGWLGHGEKFDGVTVYRPGRIPPRWQTWRLWDRFVCELHLRLLKGQNSAAGSGSCDTVIVFHPMFEPYVRNSKNVKLVFFAGDLFSAQPGWNPQLAAMQDALLERADLILCGSLSIAELLPDTARNRAKILPSAVNARTFLVEPTHQCPADLADIPRPWIGYHGNLNAKLDFSLVQAIASSHPDWHWILIGPVRELDMQAEDLDSYNAFRSCRELKNVHFLGVKPYEQIADYAARMDVLAMIYRMEAGEWVRTAYPLKLHECLATGKPVVCAPLPLVRIHADVVDIADTVDDWAKALGRAISGAGVGTPELRRHVASENTWEKRAAELDQWLREMY